MKLPILLAFVAVAAQQTCYPEHERHNTEQSALCKGAGGLPILVWDGSIQMSVYRGCQIPCQPAVVHPDVEEKR